MPCNPPQYSALVSSKPPDLTELWDLTMTQTPSHTNMARFHGRDETDSSNSTKSSDTTLINGFSIDEEASQAPPTDALHRKLKARHIQMIAIGGNIGTGLFVGSGKALHTGGPLALVVGFIMVSTSLTMMMQCLGEMSVIFPIPFTRYASRFIDPALGFAVGWQYWLCWVSIFGAESSAFVVRASDTLCGHPLTNRLV